MEYKVFDSTHSLMGEKNLPNPRLAWSEEH